MEMEEQQLQESQSNTEDKYEDNDSTITSIDLTDINADERAPMLRWFYFSKFLFTLIFIMFAFMLAVTGKIDQYVYAGVTVSGLAAYMTGKIENFFFRKK
jgi:fatty-acid desaturase